MSTNEIEKMRLRETLKNSLLRKYYAFSCYLLGVKKLLYLTSSFNDHPYKVVIFREKNYKYFFLCQRKNKIIKRLRQYNFIF